MVTFTTTLWPARTAAFMLAGLAAASAVYWGLLLQGMQVQAPLVAVETAPMVSADAGAVGRLLGGAAPVSAGPVATADASISSRLVLTAIVAAQRGSGAAVFAVDGKPAKSFSVGATVVDDWVLSSVLPRSVRLSQGGAEMTLELSGKPEITGLAANH